MQESYNDYILEIMIKQEVILVIENLITNQNKAGELAEKEFRQVEHNYKSIQVD